MRTFIAIMMVVLPGMAFAADDCRIVEFPDHTEAICVGDPVKSPAPNQINSQNRAPAAAIPLEAITATQEPDASESPDTERPEVSPENIVRNGLARVHCESVLNRLQGQW